MLSADPHEAWFLDHGLPYFVDPVRERVRRRLSRGRVVLVVLVALVLWGLATALLDAWLGDLLGSLIIAFPVALVVGVVYGLRALQAATIAGWALRRTFGSLGLLLPLATRALPMLLLFITFLFINTEVWQVASALRRGVLWGTVLFFSAAAVFFLVTRLDRELDEFDDHVGAEEMRAATRGTGWADAVDALVAGDVDLAAEAQVTGLQRVNLVLALAISQAVQVLLLAVAVFAFFMVFGLVAIDDSVVEAWVGHPPTYPGSLHVFSLELTQVAIFLAGFSGLYFTVTAVTDETYRREFFTACRRELEQAVTVRILYRHAEPVSTADTAADAG